MIIDDEEKFKSFNVAHTEMGLQMGIEIEEIPQQTVCLVRVDPGTRILDDVISEPGSGSEHISPAMSL